MCMSQFLRIKTISGMKATMEDGRIVTLGTVTDAAVGDYLEVYADIAIAKTDPGEAEAIRATRTEGMP